MASEHGDGGAPAPDDRIGHPHPIFNWMSIIGGGFVVVGITAATFFFVMGLFSHDRGAYAGLLLVPPLLLAAGGFPFFVGGWLRERRRQSRKQRRVAAD